MEKKGEMMINSINWKVSFVLLCFSVSIVSQVQAAVKTCESQPNLSEQDFYVLDISKDVLPDAVTWMNYGDPVDEFLGITAYSNKPNGKGGQWQCTELVRRFVRDIYGFPAKMGMGLGNGDSLARNLFLTFGKTPSTSEYLKGDKVRLQYFKNGCAEFPPIVGSVISFVVGKYGHVAIVRKAEAISENKIRVLLFEQHGMLRLKVGQTLPLTEVVFTQNQDGIWSGGSGAVGWTSPIKAQSK